MASTAATLCSPNQYQPVCVVCVCVCCLFLQALYEMLENCDKKAQELSAAQRRFSDDTADVDTKTGRNREAGLTSRQEEAQAAFKGVQVRRGPGCSTYNV